MSEEKKMAKYYDVIIQTDNMAPLLKLHSICLPYLQQEIAEKVKMPRSATKMTRVKRRCLIGKLMDCGTETTFKPPNGCFLEKWHGSYVKCINWKIVGQVQATIYISKKKNKLFPCSAALLFFQREQTRNRLLFCDRDVSSDFICLA